MTTKTPQTNRRNTLLRSTPAILAILACCAIPAAYAQKAPAAAKNGTLYGKIVNSSNGDYLQRARITVEGSNLETFTDDFGEYSLDLPEGSQKLHVSYTGMPDKVMDVEVIANETVMQDVSLSNQVKVSTAKGIDDVVVLDAFAVTEARETNAYNIAANEQRYSLNIKNVVSSDAFGDVTEGNVGEFIKYLPGITVDYVAADVRTINVRGFSSAFTNLSINGMRVTSSVSGSNNRAIELEQISINNVARAEVVKVPTPETPADSLGGNVNLVSKNAFERKGYSVNYRAYVSANSEDLSFKKSPGPADKNQYKILPGVDFDLTMPITKNFGIVFTGLSSNQFNEQHRTLPTWNSYNAAAGVSEVNPYLQSYTYQDGPKITHRNSINVQADWRVKPGHVLSFSYQNNFYSNFFGNRNVNFGVGTTPTSAVAGGPVLTWGPDFAQSGAGRGTVTQGSSYRTKNGQTQAGNVYYRFKSKQWEVDGGLYSSYSKSWYRDLTDGYFSGVTTTVPNVYTVRFSDIAYPRPNIMVRDNLGTMIDYGDINSYRLTTLRTQPLDGEATMRGLMGNVRRDMGLSIPFWLKTGFDVRSELRDNRRYQTDYTFLGADGKANTLDDAAGKFASDVYMNIDPHYGLSRTQWASPDKIADLFNAHPEQFSSAGVAASATTAGQASGVPSAIFKASNSIRIKETVSAAYLQAEAKLFHNKLSIITGVRFEKTEDDGYGLKVDQNAIYVRNSNGTLAKDSAGKLIRRAEAGTAGAANAVGTMMTLTEAGMIYQERGYHATSSYSGYYPSLHLNYSITDNLIARFAYAKTYGRPDFADIVPNTTVADNVLYDASNPSSTPGTINVANTGLKPWKADNFDLALEYYQTKGGMISAGVFQKNLSDFWGTLNTTLTSDMAAQLGVDPGYVGWTVQSKTNVGDATIKGLEFDIRQPLTFLGSIGKNLNFIANGTWLKLDGANTLDFKRFIARSGNIGLTWSKRPFVVMVKLNHRGRQRWDPQTGTQYQVNATTAQAGGTFYEYDNPRNTVDINLEYQFSKKLSIFANARNVFNVAQDRERFNSATPAYAHNYNSEEYGVQWACGVKGQF